MEEGLRLEIALGDRVRHGEKEGGKEDEVGEHGAEEGEGGKQPEGEGAAEAGEAEDAEAEEEDDGGVYHALPGLAEGVGDGAGHVPGGGLEFLAVFGEVVDGVVHGDAEGDAEDEDGGRLDGDAGVAHDGGGEDLGDDVGDEGDEHHTAAFEHPRHESRDEEDGEGKGGEEVGYQVFVAFEKDDAGAGDFDVVLLGREYFLDFLVEELFFFCHAAGADVLDAEADAGDAAGGVDEGVREGGSPAGGVGDVAHDEVLGHGGGEAVIFRLAVVVCLVGEFGSLDDGKPPGEVGVGGELGTEAVDALEVGELERLVGLAEIDADFEGHEPVEVVLEEGEVAADGVGVLEVVHHVAGGLHEGNAEYADEHEEDGNPVCRVAACSDNEEQAVNDTAEERALEVLHLAGVRGREVAEDGGDEDEADEEDAGNAEECHPAEVHEDLAGGDGEGGKAGGSGQVGEQGGIAHLLYHALEGFDFVAVAHVFVVVFVNHIDAVGDADDNEQRGEHGGEEGDFHLEQRHDAKRPDNADGDDAHAETHNAEGAEKEVEDDGGNQEGEGDEHEHLPFDVLGVDDADVGHAGIVHAEVVFGSEIARDAEDVVHQLHAAGGVHDLGGDGDHHAVGVPLLVVEQPVIEREGGGGTRQAVQFSGRDLRRKDGHQVETPRSGVLAEVEGVGNVHEGGDAGERLDAVAHGYPVVDFVRTEKGGVADGEHHDVALLPEHFAETGVVHVRAVRAGQEVRALV